MNTLLEGLCRMRYFTDLRLVFEAIGGRQVGFDWLITDLDCIWLDRTDDGPNPFDRMYDGPPYWATGDELTRIVKGRDLQFVWAVLSGFPPGVSLDLDRLDIEPYANGNPGFWVTRPRIQHPLAEVEIVCFDSSCTLSLCRDHFIGESFRRFFPEAVDLDEHNQDRLALRGG